MRHALNHAVVAIVLVCIRMAGTLPIRVGQQAFGQYTDVTNCQRQPAAVARITRRSRIADECHTVSVRVVDPGIGSIKRGQWAIGLRSFLILRKCTGSDDALELGQANPAGRSYHVALARKTN